MARYFVRLSYCGTAYNGWQSQPHLGTNTVQGTMEKAFSTYLREEISLVGCGRTDTGVHAKDYYAHFDAPKLEDLASIKYRVNKLLPSDIAINSIQLVHDEAHARFDAISRSYKYYLHISKSPFAARSYYYVYEEPELVKLNEAASLVLEFMDFTTFCKLNSDVRTMNCKISESYWVKDGDQYIFNIKADRFLRGMIRLIVGMCLQVARNKLAIDEVRSAIKAKVRLRNDWSVPAVGLILCDIKYPYDLP